ncbi:hypothetical protein QJS04_geneDACA024887 [Acorus gramineus]|uniref:Uncharacterized protein n=1 Tax=Acorus gramineus TaxID=55184 RepID=A0AAV8ZXJ2_ACOGR|nr:hypothetical protein QJS04_geneDACA024887 [Acorus gramineus]
MASSSTSRPSRGPKPNLRSTTLVKPTYTVRSLNQSDDGALQLPFSSSADGPHGEQLGYLHLFGEPLPRLLLPSRPRHAITNPNLPVGIGLVLRSIEVSEAGLPFARRPRHWKVRQGGLLFRRNLDPQLPPQDPGPQHCPDRRIRIHEGPPRDPPPDPQRREDPEPPSGETTIRPFNFKEVWSIQELQGDQTKRSGDSVVKTVEAAATTRREKRASAAKKAIERYERDPDYRFLYDLVCDFFAASLAADMERLKSGKLYEIGLAAKWCPSLDSSYDRSTLLSEGIATRRGRCCRMRSSRRRTASMSGTPMDVCVALGMLVAELSEEPWKGKVITFSAAPQLHLIEGETLAEKTSFVREMNWGMNTDLQAVFDRILEASARLWETDYMVIRRKFEEKGYGSVVPDIVFWNLRDSRSTPVRSMDKGVALVSGFSKNLLKLFLEGDGVIDPEIIMEAAIAGEEYSKLVVFD